MNLFLTPPHPPQFLLQVLKKISSYIQEQNEKIYAPRGLLLTDPVERGMRVVSFTHLQLCNRAANDTQSSVCFFETVKVCYKI